MIAYQIMAHPSRSEFVPALEKVLKAGVTWDEKQSRWDTGRRSWLALADSGADWGCVIQDDAVLCWGFTDVLAQALEHVPLRSPVVLYAGNVSPWRIKFRKVPRETSWLIMPRIVWGPGIVMPTHLIYDVIEYCDKLAIPNYDLRLSKWFERRRIPIYYTWPSLVEHRDSPSLVPGRSSVRHAYRFAAEPQLIDWSLQPHKLR